MINAEDFNEKIAAHTWRHPATGLVWEFREWARCYPQVLKGPDGKQIGIYAYIDELEAAANRWAENNAKEVAK